jgi:hypothetical protein
VTTVIADGPPESQDESQERAVLEGLRVRLHRDFDEAVGPEEVERALRAARSHFDGSRIRAFVPILVERRVVGELRRGSLG